MEDVLLAIYNLGSKSKNRWKWTSIH